MALAGPTLLAATASTLNVTSYASASCAPTAGALVVVAVCNTDGTNAIVPASLTSAFAITGTWTQEATIATGTGLTRYTLYSAVATGTPGTGAVTAGFGADAQTGCTIWVVEYTGQHATTPVLQAAGNEGGGAGATSLTLTLAGALQAATSQMLAFIRHNTVEDQTATGGGTELASSEVSHLTPNANGAVYFAVNDTSIGASWATTSAKLGICCEIVEAVGGGANVTGTAALATTVTISAAGTRTTFGTAAQPVTFTASAAGQRTTFGASAQQVTFNAAASGTRTTFGTLALPVTFNASASGVVEGPVVTGTASLVTTFTAAASGQRTAVGQASLATSFNTAAAGTRTTFGSAGVALTFTAGVAGGVPFIDPCALDVVLAGTEALTAALASTDALTFALATTESLTASAGGTDTLTASVAATESLTAVLPEC